MAKIYIDVNDVGDKYGIPDKYFDSDWNVKLPAMTKKQFYTFLRDTSDQSVFEKESNIIWDYINSLPTSDENNLTAQEALRFYFGVTFFTVSDLIANESVYDSIVKYNEEYVYLSDYSSFEELFNAIKDWASYFGIYVGFYKQDGEYVVGIDTSKSEIDFFNNFPNYFGAY